MNYEKYMSNNKYELGVNDCWTLMQDIFKEEHGIELPEYPYCVEGKKKEVAQYFKSNLVVDRIEKPTKGCLVHVSGGTVEHIGYAINAKQYIHKQYRGVSITNIPKKAIYYTVGGSNA